MMAAVNSQNTQKIKQQDAVIPLLIVRCEISWY
jgi:hypothetical protein